MIIKKIYRMGIDADIAAIVNITDESFDRLSEKNTYSSCKLKALSFDLAFERNTTLTDALNEGTLLLDGLPISNDLYQIFIKYNLHDIQFIDMIGEGLNGYKFMFFNGDLTTKINYKKSNFILIKESLLDQHILDTKVLPNRNAVIQANLDCCSSIFKKLVPMNGYIFNRFFNIFKKDVFRIGYFDYSFYVSELVKLAIEENNITGLMFSEVSIFDKDYKHELANT